MMWAVLLLGAVGSVLGADNTFASLKAMEDLVDKEASLIEYLHSAIEHEQEKLVKLKRYMAHLEEGHQKATLDPKAYVTNPLNSFYMMQRLTTDWQDIKDLITNPPPKLLEVEEDLDLPVMDDLIGAAEALCRLQDTYKLNTSELSRGMIHGVQYSQPMTANDAYIIGQQMYRISDFYHANMWFEAALELHNGEVGTSPLIPTNKSTILDYTAFSVYSLGNVRKALQITEEYLELMPNCTRNQENRAGYKDIINSANQEQVPDDIEKHKPRSYYWDPVIQGKYEQLCRGEVEVNHALVCRYKDNGHPYFRLRRVKMEEMSLEPEILVFHDVIYDSEIQTIKELARPEIKRSYVTNFGEEENFKEWFDKTRVSMTAFLSESAHEVVARVDRRAGMLAGLRPESAEHLQVLNYGIGGHYEPHYDFSQSTEPNRGFQDFDGNRIATLLYYMSDVEKGGATVFPDIGAAVFPSKGSAVLWYNLHRDGEGDLRTRHGACPVLIGDKWACNKWFHEGLQEFLRPCLLEQDSLLFNPTTTSDTRDADVISHDTCIIENTNDSDSTDTALQPSSTWADYIEGCEHSIQDNTPEYDECD